MVRAAIAPRTTLPRPGIIPTSIPWPRARAAGRPSPSIPPRRNRRRPAKRRARIACRLSPAPRGGRASTAQSVVYPRTRSNAFAQAPSVTPLSPPPLAAAEAAAPPARPTGEAAPNAYPPAPRTAARQAYPAQPQATSAEAPAYADAPPVPAEPVSPPAPADRSFVLQDGRYAPPPAQDIPDWLTAARQNQTAPHAPSRRASRRRRRPPPLRWTRWEGPSPTNPGAAPTFTKPPAIRPTSSPSSAARKPRP